MINKVQIIHTTQYIREIISDFLEELVGRAAVLARGERVAATSLQCGPSLSTSHVTQDLYHAEMVGTGVDDTCPSVEHPILVCHSMHSACKDSGIRIAYGLPATTLWSTSHPRGSTAPQRTRSMHLATQRKSVVDLEQTMSLLGLFHGPNRMRHMTIKLKARWIHH